MRLLESLEKLTAIEDFVYNDKLPMEAEREALQLEVTQRTDAVALAFKHRKDEIEYLRSVRNLVKKREDQLVKFKHLLSEVVRRHGNLNTPLASISLRKRETEQVVILNFETVQKAYPEVVTIEDKDNVRTIRLNKTMLKAIPLPHKGFFVQKNETEFVDVRVKR